jgi:hypothetical protein
MKDILLQWLPLLVCFLLTQWQITSLKGRVVADKRDVDETLAKHMGDIESLAYSIMQIAELLEESGHTLPVQCGRPECKGSNIIPFQKKDK